MTHPALLAASIILLAGLALPADAFARSAAPAPDCPPGVSTGSGDVMVGGGQAARAGDTVGCGTVAGGSPDVIINGRPAAVTGSPTDCGGTISGGGTGVFINGKPVARAGDSAPCKR